MANIRRMTKKRLGELLLQEGLITDEQLEISLEEQQQTGELIGEILVRKGYVNESDIARTISLQFSFPYLSVSHYYIGPEVQGLFGLETLEKHCFVPIDRFGDVLGIVIAGLLEQDTIDEIEKKTGATIQVYVGKVSEVKQVIREKFAEKASKAKVAAPAEEVVDVTAPLTAATAPKKKAPEEPEVEDLADLVAGADSGESQLEGDAAVVEQLEKQFKQFRDIEEEAGESGDEDDDS